MYPENWDTCQLFLSVSTQWRMGSAGGIVGLDYTAVEAAITRLEMKVTKTQFRGLQIMESAAIEAINGKLTHV